MKKMKNYTVESNAGTLSVEELGTVKTSVNGEEYRAGMVNGELCVWAPEVGVADSLVTIDDIGNNWGGDEEDLAQLILEAKALESSRV